MRAALLTGWRFLKFVSLSFRAQKDVLCFFLFSASPALSSLKVSSFFFFSLSLSLYISRDTDRDTRAQVSFSLVFKMTIFFSLVPIFFCLFKKKREFVVKRGGTKRQTGGDFESEEITTLQIVDRGVACSCSVCALFILSRAICAYIFYINILIYRSIWFCRRLVDPRELPSLRWYRRRRRLSGIRRRRRNHRP